jgi:hypothetical protein
MPDIESVLSELWGDKVRSFKSEQVGEHHQIHHFKVQTIVSPEP